MTNHEITEKLARALRETARFALSYDGTNSGEHEAAMRNADVALAAYEASKSQTQGWELVLVPKEPTKVMVHALCDAEGWCLKCDETREDATYGTVYPMCYGLAKERYANAIAAAPAQSSATVAKDAWLPIESAPKDRITCYWPDGSIETVNWDAYFYARIYDIPTHWMPLPQPPQSEAR